MKITQIEIIKNDNDNYLFTKLKIKAIITNNKLKTDLKFLRMTKLII